MTPPTQVRRDVLETAGFPVDAVYGRFAQYILGVYGLVCSACIAFNPNSEMRMMSADALTALPTQPRLRKMVTTVLINMCNSSVNQSVVDPAFIIGAMTPLTKMYSTRLRVESEVPTAVSEAVENLLSHSNFHVKTAAVQAAGEMQLKQTQPQLEAITNNESDMLLRDTAEAAIQTINASIPRR